MDLMNLEVIFNLNDSITQTFLLFTFDHSTLATQLAEDLGKTPQKKKLKNIFRRFLVLIIYLCSLILLTWKKENTFNVDLQYFIWNPLPQTQKLLFAYNLFINKGFSDIVNVLEKPYIYY